MNITLDDLIKLADFLDENGETEAAEQVDVLIKRKVSESKTGMKEVFKRLATVADELDGAGATDEANLIDDFISKNAAHYGEPFTPEEIDMPKCVVCANPKPEDVCTYCGAGQEEEMGDEMESMEAETDLAKDRKPRATSYEEAIKNKMKQEQDTLDYLKWMLDEMQSGRNPDPRMFEMVKKIKELKEDQDKHRLYQTEYLKRQTQSNAKPDLTKQAEDVVKWQPEGKTDQSKRYDTKHNHQLMVREPKRKQEQSTRERGDEHHVKTYKQTNAPSLSHRYCPDHIGVQLVRVGEGVYQCSLDNEVYNWEAGFTDANGVEYPGGSVAGQTPGATDYQTPNRVFDSRR